MFIWYDCARRVFATAVLFCLVIFVKAAIEPVPAKAQEPGTANWYTVAANAQRTSWVSEEVRGNLDPLWYKPFEAYISQKTQLISVDGTLYVATTRGLYALDAATGAEQWRYATDMPLGHSPTVVDGTAYVGGFDHRLHAIDSATGTRKWVFEAQAGFQVNPLVVNDLVFAGNRDGTFYAIHASGLREGQLAWSYAVGAPILTSAAFADDVVYFAANDARAYALDAQTGQLVWQSSQLSGAGFHAWWPVVTTDRVILSGNPNYRRAVPNPNHIHELELDEMNPNHDSVPRGTLYGSAGTQSGDWVAQTPTLDMQIVLDYLTNKPWRKSVWVLNQSDGQEAETAPLLYAGNSGAGSRYPPVVGNDGVLYQQNVYMSDPYIAGGHLSGWQPGSSHISVISSDWGASDEPHAASGGGNLIYWNLCCDRQAGAIDIGQPYTVFTENVQNGVVPPIKGQGNPDREWFYFGYNLDDLLPGYNDAYHNPDDDYSSPYASYGGPNGVYGFHGDTNPPVPHQGRVFMHRGNSVIAFAPDVASPTQLPAATIAASPDSTRVNLPAGYLQAELEAEVQQMLDAGHLRPGYRSHGIFDLRGKSTCGDELTDYFHNTSDTIYTLLMVLPHLPPAMQGQVESYLQTEFTTYPPYRYNHVGWRDGAAREIFATPSDVQASMNSIGPAEKNYTFLNNGGWEGEGVWGRNPFTFYALWKYAQAFGGAAQLLQDSQPMFDEEFAAQPSDTLLLNMPALHNAYIAGYIGYLALQTLAGVSPSSQVQQELNRLLALRADNFSTDSAYRNFASGNVAAYCRTLNIASNFMYLVPELADYLRTNALPEVEAALIRYENLAPYWFVSFAEEGFGENGFATLYDAHTNFMARAMILQTPPSALEAYLDVPGFDRGDLFYLQKLAFLLTDQEDSFSLSVTPVTQTLRPGASANVEVSVIPTGDFTEPVTVQVASPISALLVSPTQFSGVPPVVRNLTISYAADCNCTGQLASSSYVIEVQASGGGVNQSGSIAVRLLRYDVYLPLSLR